MPRRHSTSTRKPLRCISLTSDSSGTYTSSCDQALKIAAARGPVYVSRRWAFHASPCARAIAESIAGWQSTLMKRPRGPTAVRMRRYRPAFAPRVRTWCSANDATTPSQAGSGVRRKVPDVNVARPRSRRAASVRMSASASMATMRARGAASRQRAASAPVPVPRSTIVRARPGMAAAATSSISSQSGMNVRIRVSHSARWIPRCEATPMVTLHSRGTPGPAAPDIAGTRDLFRPACTDRRWIRETR